MEKSTELLCTSMYMYFWFSDLVLTSVSTLTEHIYHVLSLILAKRWSTWTSCFITKCTYNTICYITLKAIKYLLKIFVKYSSYITAICWPFEVIQLNCLHSNFKYRNLSTCIRYSQYKGYIRLHVPGLGKT